MAATTPVSDAELEQIRALHTQGESCSAIAEALGRSKSTITRQCRKLGLSFDRAQTRAATEAKQADNRAARAEAARILLADFHLLRKRAWSPYTVVVGTGEGAELVELALPPAQDVRAFYMSMGACVDKHMALERHDSDDGQGMSAVDAWLRGMLGGG